MNTVFLDIHKTIEEILIEENKAAACIALKGTNTDHLIGCQFLPPINENVGQ